MKYLIKKTNDGWLVKDASTGKIQLGKDFEIVERLPEGSLYRERAETSENGEVSSVKTYFTAKSESELKDRLYAKAFMTLLSDLSVHEQGVSYPALSKLALAEMEKSPATADDLVAGVLSVIEIS